jgi:chitinase
MKYLASIPPALLLPGFMVLGLLTACDSRSGSGPGPGPEIHDSKYVAIDAEGGQLEPGVPGPCVLDQFTGLIWQAKSDVPGLNSRDNTYSWFNPNEDAGGELDYRGKPDGGACSGSACDTWAVVLATNEAGYCGYKDWRMPLRDELGSISDPRKTRTPPTINTLYCPNTRSGDYWSSNDYQFQWNTAWLWSFENGLDRVEWKETPKYVRLVRGEADYLERIKD